MQALEECEAFAWERSKENVAPVHCGRNVDKLNVVLAEVDSSNHHSKLISQERELLHNIATYCGEDPLMSWLEYYKWVQEYFPSDVKKILAVLEQITHEFKGNKKYRNDVRYMKLWVAYADKVEKPLEVFMFLHKHKIGDKLSLFYIAWAFLCEKSGKIKDAETIFNRGFQKNAEPRETLKKKYDEFNCRVIKAWTKSSEDNYEGSQRSYASVYASQLVEESSSGDKMTEVAVKHETRVGYLPWEFYCVNEIISRLSKDEQHPSFETIIRMYTLHVFQNATLLIQQRGDRGTLHGLVNKYAQHGRRIPEQIAVYYAYQMFATVDIVHKARFLHGDIKPDNWILVDGQSYWDTRETFSTGAVCLIDFGRAIDLDYYPKDFAFCGDCHASGFQCIEMLTKETWTYQIDTFGLCASIHLLLFGDYMEVKYISKTGKWMPKRPWKRYWQCQLWSDLFSTFLNIPPGSTTQPSLQWWCSKLERYFTDNETNKTVCHANAERGY
ncbi:BUB protein kinase [Aphanomyces invadans]|uniref:BUB protein kinase n=1 Tax=Aphanomyces invadans TaxID=157072 RepID=A0A024TMG9_9STRA|nr:BUB protein kinase [Aphanomyces invadans]ETV95228.1 BUB protein kinase [Aphanomyces invadans]|eukprot:XP_008875929.1 BUB protein kinase [Aphanomyces invadans]